jgi:D-hydroxyproline dehydrogenase subunit alpha
MDLRTAEFDVVVVGAGPGGMAAAAVAAEAGLAVCLLDDNLSPGGQIWRGYRAETAKKWPHGQVFLDWITRLQRSGCEVWSGSQVVGQPAPNMLRLQRGDGECDVAYEKLIVATGARELFLPFHGWTLPGVMGAGGLQALVKSGLDPRGKRVVLAGSGPLLLAVAANLQLAGARVQGVFEQAPLARLLPFSLRLLGQPSKLVEGLRYRVQTFSAPYRTGTWVVKAEGRGRVEHVTLSNGRRQWSVDCDWLGCGFHLVPNLELPRLLGCEIADGFVTVDDSRQSSVANVACIGELTGIGGVEKALIEGQIAGLAAAGREVDAERLRAKLQRQMGFVRGMRDAFALRAELRELATADTLVCRCEDVPLGALQFCKDWREAKLHTRCGMGACQGRICGTATEFLFGWKNAGVRPPVFPANVSTVGAAVEEARLHG